MNRLGIKERTRIIACLVEGNSIRSTVRMTGIAKNTVTKLLVEIGRACTEYQDKAMEAGISDHVWTLEEIVALIDK